LLVADDLRWKSTLSTNTDANKLNNDDPNPIECISRNDIREHYLSNPSFRLHECTEKYVNFDTPLKTKNEPTYVRLPIPFPFYLYEKSFIKLLDQLDELENKQLSTSESQKTFYLFIIRKIVGDQGKIQISASDQVLGADGTYVSAEHCQAGSDFTLSELVQTYIEPIDANTATDLVKDVEVEVSISNDNDDNEIIDNNGNGPFSSIPAGDFHPLSTFIEKQIWSADPIAFPNNGATCSDTESAALMKLIKKTKHLRKYIPFIRKKFKPCKVLGVMCENGHVVGIHWPSIALAKPGKTGKSSKSDTFGDTLSNLPHLRYLNLRNVSIVQLSNSICSCKQLSAINLSGKKMKNHSLPSCLQNMNIVHFFIANAPSFDFDISNWKLLRSLEIQ
jgi:hypothetical protein